jgi:hypothetical protein
VLCIEKSKTCGLAVKAERHLQRDPAAERVFRDIGPSQFSSCSRAKMSSAIASKLNGRSISAVCPCPCNSTAMPWRSFAKASMFAPNAAMPTYPDLLSIATNFLPIFIDREFRVRRVSQEAPATPAILGNRLPGGNSSEVRSASNRGMAKRKGELI